MKKIKSLVLFGIFALPMCFGVSAKFLSSDAEDLSETDLELIKTQTAMAYCPGYEPTYYAVACDPQGFDDCVNFCC